MKKTFNITAALIILLTVFTGCVSTPKAGGQDELDTAIRDASDYLNDNIPEKSKIVILNIQSDSAALSDYIIDELIANAVNDRLFEVVDRQQLDLIRTEQNFQWSGEVDDNAALEIGKFFGAQIIVSGRVSQIADRYRFTIRALEVQTARVVGQNNTNISAGRTITALMRSGTGGAGGTATASGGRTTAGSGTASSGTSGGTTTAATPAQPAAIANGTYIFYPRLRATEAGRDVDAYLDRIVVRGNYFNVYIVGFPVGDINRNSQSIHGSNNWYGDLSTYILQDLVTPRLTYNPINVTYDPPRTLSFQNIRPAKRFSLTYTRGSVPVIFEEIDLDKAEYEP